jgi:hypothetical protein
VKIVSSDPGKVFSGKIIMPLPKVSFAVSRVVNGKLGGRHYDLFCTK